MEISNYFNDGRPVIVHQISIKDKFESSFEYIRRCTGLSWDPLYDPNKKFGLPGLKDIPVVSAVRYEEKGNQMNSDYISDDKYLEIESNKVYIIDFIVSTRKDQIKIVCKTAGCETCDEAERVSFKKINSAVEFLVDRPDFDDNTKIIYKKTESITF